MIKLLTIIGARPQFIKHFPFERACDRKVNLITVHTGQHYDEKMSAVFFDQLGMKKPDYQLSAGGGHHGAQTGKMMNDIELIALEEKPDFMVVYGDTNSTLAGALVASKMHIPVVHIEAGLRSYNRAMPEEINRVLTDHLSAMLLCPGQTAVENLAKEGITKGVHIIGDLMKDLAAYVINSQQLISPDIKNDFYYVTLHRPYNVDEKDRLIQILDALNKLDKPCVFAIHPRTRNMMTTYGIAQESYQNIDFIDPQPYFENLGYIHASSGLITDSGGMQKEAYWLEKPCITVRSETEWVETLDGDANRLVFHHLGELNEGFNKRSPVFDKNLYGDSKAAEKIVDLILSSFYN